MAFFKDNQTPRGRYCFAAGVVVAVTPRTPRAHLRGRQPHLWWADGCGGDGHGRTHSFAVRRSRVVVLGLFDWVKNS